MMLGSTSEFILTQIARRLARPRMGDLVLDQLEDAASAA